MAKDPAFPGTLKQAALLTLALSLVYLVLAAALVPALDAGPERIRQNATLADNLPPPSHSPQYLLWGIWQRFDTLWYRRVAERGYDTPETVVFYPLYPLVIRAAALLGLPTAPGAILIARCATFFLLWGLILLLRMDLDPGDARKALALLLAWPMSFILLGGYAEPFLMCFTVWAIWFARNHRWWPAALCCALACQSRAVGMVALAPLAWLAWRQKAFRPLPFLLALSAPFWFPLWLKLNALPLSSQVYPLYWRTSMAWPWTTLIDAFRFYSTDLAWFVSLNGAAMLLVFGVALARPLRADYFLYALGTLAFILTANARPPLHSYVRYVLPVFPAFASAARLLRHPLAFAAVWCGLFLVNLVLLYAFWDWFFLV
ncbi:MAG: hypothetical protein HZB13_00010 [Acidobacteria bacterium]|nr:hypothetical protein [Acidobacteriota bacterium]